MTFSPLAERGTRRVHHYLRELEQPAWIGGKTARGLFGQAQPALFTGFGFVARGKRLVSGEGNELWAQRLDSL